MKMLTIRLLLVLALCGMAGAGVYAQDPQGAQQGGQDASQHSGQKTKHHWFWHRSQHTKRAKGEKHHKHQKDETTSAANTHGGPLYTVPKSLSRWHGGGPGPAGAGVPQ